MKIYSHILFLGEKNEGARQDILWINNNWFHDPWSESSKAVYGTSFDWPMPYAQSLGQNSLKSFAFADFQRGRQLMPPFPNKWFGWGEREREKEREREREREIDLSFLESLFYGLESERDWLKLLGITILWGLF